MPQLMRFIAPVSKSGYAYYYFEYNFETMSLRNALIQLRVNAYCISSVRIVYNAALRIAELYIRNKISQGNLKPGMLGYKTMDLVSYSIAELFIRDHENRLIILDRYEPFRQIEKLPDNELINSFKSIVVTKVKDSLFELIRQHDPQLSKLIRNIKCCISRDPEIFYDQNSYLIFYQIDEQECNYVPEELLKIQLVPRISSRTDIPDIIDLIKETLAVEGKNFAIKLTSLALLIREACSCYYEVDEYSTYTEEDLRKRELKEMIAGIIDDIKKEYSIKYVEKRKVPAHIYEGYIQSIQNMYFSVIESGEAGKSPMHVFVNEIIPEINEADYRAHHRTVVEYLFKLSKNRVQKLLKRESVLYSLMN